MLQILYTIIFSLCYLGSIFCQVPDELLDKKQYPANNTADSKRQAIFASYFEDANVSNLHVYSPREEPSFDYYFKGEELPKGLFGIFDPDWRREMPDDFKAFAVFSIRGEGKPYYLLRFEGPDLHPMIDLFEMQGDRLVHKLNLSTYWCGVDLCVQKDSWLQDFDGDVRLDILSKVRMTDNRKNVDFIDEYYNKYRQLKNGNLAKDSKLEIEVNNYRMFPRKEQD